MNLHAGKGVATQQSNGSNPLRSWNPSLGPIESFALLDLVSEILLQALLGSRIVVVINYQIFNLNRGLPPHSL